MLDQHSTSPLDFSFTIFGIPVRVSGWFWLLSGILGWTSIHQGVDFLAAWMLVCFVSVLVHELGHALTARGFGYRVWVTLHQMGGVAQYDQLEGHTLWRSIMITIAGPLAGFLLFVLVLILDPLFFDPLRLNMGPRASLLVDEIVNDLIWVNLFWGILNLIPVFPLDGGQLCRDCLLLISRRHGLLWSLQISIVVAFLVALLSLKVGLMYTAMLFGILGFESISKLQNHRSP